MRTFEIGKKYSMRSICDHNCVWTFTVTARTAQTVTITDGKETKKCRINKKYSEYGSSVYTLTEKEGVDQNITYTNVQGDSYWPRVCRHIRTKKTDQIRIGIRKMVKILF